MTASSVRLAFRHECIGSTPRERTVLIRQGHLRQIGAPTLIGAVVLLISALLLLGANVAALRNSFAWVQRTDDTLLRISDVEIHVVNDDLAMRGYTLTGDPSFVTYQKMEQQKVDDAMKRLATLLSGEASQTIRFAELRRLTGQRLALFVHLMNLGPGHEQEVGAAVLDPENRTVMRAARAEMATLRDEELKLLANRQAAVAEQSTRAYELAIGIVVLAFVFGALGLAFA
jgi:CHASE3 domain sensor protein